MAEPTSIATSDLRALRSRPRRLLAVFAHPDDEAYGAAGAMARAAADPDAAVVLLALTRGEASSILAARGLSRADVGELRAARLREVAGILGLDALLLPGLPDGRLARLPVAEVASPIRAALEALRPQVVIGHDPRGVNGHLDHVASHWAIRRALEDADGVRFAMVAYRDEDCEAASPRLLFPTPDSEIDAVLDLSEAEIERKEACLRVHEAIATLRPDADPALLRRPPEERFSFLGERLAARVDNLFAGLGPGTGAS